ncbi:MAG: BON domain-containing protein, partial [Nitrospinaceae bacterium]|nr:BON domain-containing protein [Nitrospinaceae bacterium]NIR54183.1 BON domain-containing protein [Nitrospinaceae bacterium]NIS84601.1 BON domain-containing protein [Nitrospinaceae bacterium]NIT81393.1 BON domain-containing protein [Nitrospinaceae bacterium]NIU43680.1 BON domain-containing protein [Nitrospinaceae bacterium]
VNGVQSVEAGGLEVDPGKEDKNRRQSPLTLQTDEEIQQAIQTAFQYDPRVENFHPKVQVDDGVVTLTGAVGNLQAKKAAESDARNTVGVRRVKNYLRVRPPQTWTDAEIRENLKKAFARNPNLEKKKIGVVVRNQQVTLAGAVDSYYEKGLAEETASKVKGVVEVDNHLVVRDYARVYSRFSYYTDPDLAFFLWSNKTDQEIRDDIKDQFFWNPFIDSDAISVSVDHGVVTLKGWV